MFDEQDEQNLTEDMAGASAALLLLLGLSRSKRRVEWDAAFGRFRIDGRLVSDATMRRLLGEIETRFGVKAAKLTEDYFENRITLDAWADGMERQLKSHHWAAAALMAGGLALALRTGVLGSEVSRQIAFKEGFKADLRRGKVSKAKGIPRGRSYAKAVTITAKRIEHFIKSLIYNEARRVRRASESCSACVDYAGRGWIPIAEMPAIGTLLCRWNCKCFIEYRR